MDKTAFDSAALGELFSQCFQGGEIRRRELRLTSAQVEYLRNDYPVTVRPLGGNWYDIQLEDPAPSHQTARAAFC